MKKNLFLFLTIFPLISFGQDTFLKIYDDNSFRFPGDPAVLESGNILLPVVSQTDTSWRTVLFKFDESGDTISTIRDLNVGNNYSMLSKIHKVGNGELLIFGSCFATGSTTYDLWVVNMDTNFNFIDESFYKTESGYINLMNSITNNNQEVILFFSTVGILSNIGYNALYCFNTTGDSICGIKYDTPDFHLAYDILQAKDSNGYYLFSIWPDLVPGQGKTSIIKVDNNFNVEKIVGHTNNISSNTSEWFSDTSFICTGYKYFLSSDTVERTGISIVDTNGNVLDNYYWGVLGDTVYQPTVLNNLGFHDGKIFLEGH